MAEITPMLIYGAGGFARELAWLAESCFRNGSSLAPVAFIDDAADSDEPLQFLNGLPVLTLDQAVAQYPGASFSVGIGSPRIRQMVTTKAVAKGLSETTLIHPRVEISKFVEIGAGVVICAGSILTTNIELRRGVQINLDCTVGHDVVLEDFVTLAPGAHVSGNVRIGKRAYVGTGAVIINGVSGTPLVIGDDAVIGAGACVTRSVGSGLTAVGVPAKPLEKKVAANVHVAA